MKGKTPIKFSPEMCGFGKKMPYKKRVATIRTDKCIECDTEPCGCKPWNVASAQTLGYRRERTDTERARPPNPHTTQGKEFHKDAKKWYCNYCKHDHCILECPELWICRHGNKPMPKNVLSAYNNEDGSKRYEGGRDPKTWEVRPISSSTGHFRISI